MKKFYFFVALFFAASTQAQVVTLSGNMSVPRWAHVSINIGNNRVLTAGGDDGSFSSGVTYASAEIWTNGTWAHTGSMHLPRTNFAAVLLNNGKVLAIGGETVGLDGYYASCELYDPSTGVWSYTDSLKTGPRAHHSAVLLNNGKVLAAGGYSNDTAEIFDPSTNTWSRTGTMLHDHGQDLTLVKLQNGKVLAVGGDDCLNCGEVYDPATGQWTATTNQTFYSREASAGVLLNSGKVLVSGGVPFDGQTTSELYDPSTNSFDTTAGPLLTNMGECPTVLLDDGNALCWCLGDFFELDGYSDFLQGYNPSTSKWYRVIKTTDIGTQVNTITKLNNNQVLVVGGSYTTGNGAANNSWLINGNEISATAVTDLNMGSFGVLPNPGSTYVQLQFQNPEEISRVRIEDLQGRCLKEVIQNFNNTIPVQELPTGMYLIRLYNHNQEMTGVQKWIKQ